MSELRARLDTYFRIVVRNIRDSIPKIIGNFLVRAVQNKMQLELFKRLGEMREAVNRSLGEVARRLTGVAPGHCGGAPGFESAA